MDDMAYNLWSNRIHKTTRISPRLKVVPDTTIGCYYGEFTLASTLNFRRIPFREKLSIRRKTQQQVREYQEDEKIFADRYEDFSASDFLTMLNEED